MYLIKDILCKKGQTKWLKQKINIGQMNLYKKIQAVTLRWADKQTSRRIDLGAEIYNYRVASLLKIRKIKE